MTRIRFLKGKHYKGQTFYAGEEATIDAVWADRFIRDGAAVAVAVPRLTPPEVIETRDPMPAKRGKK